MRDLHGWAGESLVPLLKDPNKNWQPADLLPDSGSDRFIDELQQIQSAASNLPDEYLVALVGDMVTEEALPSYMNMLNLLEETQVSFMVYYYPKRTP